MIYALIIISLIISGATLAVCAIIFSKIKNSPAQSSSPIDSNLQEKINRIGYYAENGAQTMQGYFELSSKNQSAQLAQMQEKIGLLNKTTEQRLADIQRILTGELKYMNEQNAKNLENIRQTVDEKLSSTLENRLHKSYSIIN